MKRIILIVLIILAAFVVFSSKTLFVRPPVTTVINTNTPSSISVTLDTGSTIATVSGINARNAFQALSEAAKKQNLKLTTKQYNFGVFVEQIGTIANTKEKSWIYFVNGKSGTVAADKHSLHAGDTVEWKYVTPTIE
jgi:biopolymer transport protein ExbD